jgi:hypothetical protein
MPRCKAPEILRNKAYLQGTSLTKDEGNAADGRFSSACQADDGIGLPPPIAAVVAGSRIVGDLFLLDVGDESCAVVGK